MTSREWVRIVMQALITIGVCGTVLILRLEGMDVPEALKFVAGTTVGLWIPMQYPKNGSHHHHEGGGSA